MNRRNSIFAAIGTIIAGYLSLSASHTAAEPQSGLREAFGAGTQDGSASPPQGNARATTETIRFRLLHVYDPMVSCEAFRMLAPVTWQAQGGIQWRPDSAGLAVTALQISDPSKQIAVEFMPTDCFCHAAHLSGYIPVGANYLGMEMRPPIQDPGEFLSTILLPRCRGRQFQARIVEVTRLPNVEREIAKAFYEPGCNKTFIATRIRLEYENSGVAMEEDVHSVLWYTKVDGVPGFLQWGSEFVYSFRAPRGQLDAVTPVMQAMVSSLQIDQGWFNAFEQVRHLFLQRLANGSRAAGELSRYITQVNSEITDIIRTTYENRQRSQDRIHRNFSNYIRGVDDYQSPWQNHPVQLPSGYQHAWTNAAGEYVLSNDVNFNPNLNSNLNWVLMKNTR